MNLLRRNYDLVASAGTAALFAALHVPAWLWVAYAAMLTYQIGNRIIRGWSR